MVVKLKSYVFFASNPTRYRHVRMGVADTRDPYFDSALFIKRQGFTPSTA